MCNLFFKYFIKQKKNILFLIIIISFGLIMSSISKIENKKTNDEYISSKEESLKYHESIVKEAEEKLSQNNLTKEEIEEMKKLIDSFDEEDQEEDKDGNKSN